MLMIHGMWGRPGVWQNFIPYFAGLGYAVEAPVLRYHELQPGDAPAELGRLSLADYADELEAVIRKSDGLPILMGHSMGGLIAQILASRGLARAVILLAPAVSPAFSALRPETIRIFRRLFIRRRFWDRPQCLGQNQAIYGLFHRLTPEERERQIAAMAADSGRVLFEIALPSLDRSRAAQVDIERIGCPLLIVAGAADRMIPVGGLRRLASRYGPRARYLELPDHAHWLMGEPGWQDIARSCAE
jgi:non-heme chloroperoxidase